MVSNVQDSRTHARLAPRFWPAWIGLAALRVVSLLPWRWHAALGGVLGRLALATVARRRKIAADNLACAFPDLSAAERAALLRAHAGALGTGLLGFGLAWWASDARILRWCDIEGLEHLQPASEQPTVLVGAHFTTLDLGLRALSLFVQFAAVHRPLGHPVIDPVSRSGRLRSSDRLISKHRPRELLEAMRAGDTVWIAVDQADTTGAAVTAPFFGHPVATGTTVSRCVRRYGARALPVHAVRCPNGRIRVVVGPPLELSGTDEQADATCLNQTVAGMIADAPAQYYWVHRRFRGATPS